MSTTNRRIALGGLGAAALGLIAAASRSASAQTNGINALIAVTAQKAQNANDEALQAADKQRELVKKQRDLRAQAREMERLRELEQTAKVHADILADLKRIQAELKKLPCK